MTKNMHMNAARRRTFSSTLFERGSDKLKKEILDSIATEYSILHTEGYIHIHDLEGYGNTYNCLTPDVIRNFPFESFSVKSNARKITGIFEHYKVIITGLANEQTGGIAFANFDEEIDTVLKELGVEYDAGTKDLIECSVCNFVDWINTTRTRNGQECYYVSLNIGLSFGAFGRLVTKTLLEYFRNSPSEYIRPNIIFKLKSGINYKESDNNYDLYLLALKCTAAKMIPTFLLGDSFSNAEYSLRELAVMGCRTRVVQNFNGLETSIGRGNIAYVTINLPRIALEVSENNRNASIEDNLCFFKNKWHEIAVTVKEILLDRYKRLVEQNKELMSFNFDKNLWIEDFRDSKDMENVFRHGTLSVGFIGLSETMEILTGSKYYASETNLSNAKDIVEYMREVLDSFRFQTKLNFTLLATSGEYISGRFCEIDKKHFQHPILDKGYYTNSFHVDVDEVIHPFKKLEYEGVFHKLCNGGCISYVELRSAPLDNNEALLELVSKSVEVGMSYLGINYPMDLCRECGNKGTFDECNVCKSHNILRIRRVSGYLENLEYFTSGKTAEVKNRKYYNLEE